MMEMEAQPQPAPNGNPYEVALFKYCSPRVTSFPIDLLQSIHRLFNLYHNLRNFAGSSLHGPVSGNDGTMKSEMQTWQAKMTFTDWQIDLQFEVKTIPASRFKPDLFSLFLLDFSLKKA